MTIQNYEMTSNLVDNNLIIKIVGKFDFQSHNDFQKIYEDFEKYENVNFIVDLTETTSIDSSGLGMLLLLRNYAGEEEDSVELLVQDNDVYKILGISRFETLFKIKETYS